MVTVILTKDVENYGRAGDVVTVSPGHARNFLLRRGLAMVATPAHVAQQKERAERLAAEAAERRTQAERLSRMLDGKAITLLAKHDRGTLFGAVDVAAVAASVGRLVGETIAPSVVALPKPIKTVGDHEVVLTFMDGLSATIRVSVQGE